MRMIQEETYVMLHKKETLYTSFFVAIPTAVILFFLTVAGNFFIAIFFGLLFGAMMFGFIYGLRLMVFRGHIRKRNKMVFEAPYIEVRFKNEFGALQFYPDFIRYTPLTTGSQEKEFDIIPGDNIFIGVGQIAYSKLQKLRKRDIEEGSVLVKEMPYGMGRQFLFYNVEDALEKVASYVDAYPKYQG